MSALDATDRKIIELLKKDSRKPYTEIASTLGISDSTIHVRLKKMRDHGILRGFTVDINEEALGRRVRGLAMINVELGYLEEVVSLLSLFDGVGSVFEVHGVNDLVVLLDAVDLDGLRQLIMDIRKIEHVASTTLTTILKVWK